MRKFVIYNNVIYARPNYLTNHVNLNGTRLTHWGRVMHICVSKLTIISSDNGLSPGRRQAIIWTNVKILLIRTLETKFSEILGKIHSFPFSKMHLKMASAKWRLCGLGLNELTPQPGDSLRSSARGPLGCYTGMPQAYLFEPQVPQEF